ncbi:hypothetical protein P7C73_g575, partial [Tremellales sp. Uapishka_1]
MSSSSTRRIQKASIIPSVRAWTKLIPTQELSDLMTDPIKDILVIPAEENIRNWDILITGPPGTPYAKGKFKLTVAFGPDFPFKAPDFKFVTKTHHPNIDSDGNLCIGLLKTENWKPSTKIATVLVSIYDLLEHPNPDDPLVTSIADQYRTDLAGFNKKALEYTGKYAR